jgi:hypothetical protein
MQSSGKLKDSHVSNIFLSPNMGENHKLMIELDTELPLCTSSYLRHILYRKQNYWPALGAPSGTSKTRSRDILKLLLIGRPLLPTET